MKLLFMVLVFAGSLASAEVDYVAIGAMLKEGNKQVSLGKNAVACLIKEYANNQTCETLEKVNGEIQKLFNYGLMRDCNGSLVFGFHELEMYAKDAREMAREASKEDAVWGLIERYEASVVQYRAEVVDAVKKARFQEIYTTKCMNGAEPTPDSLLDRLCKQ